MNNELLKRIKDQLLASPPSVTFAPVSDDVIAEAETSLGFEIPSLLKAIYANVANGGFGPGYGIIGINGGHASDLGTLVETYSEVGKAAKYLGLEW